MSFPIRLNETVVHDSDPTTKITLSFTVGVGGRKEVLKAVDEAHQDNSLEPILLFWWNNLPPERRLSLIAEATTETLLR